MSKIHLLEDEVSNRIAAGEVVERPASVVKELVENALDAGGTIINIRIEQAGKRLIAVSDNGEGMDADDALLCFEPHATSKIATEDDILHIRSFGFRGEAMPSIASVSRMTVRTRRADAPEGTLVRINGGILEESSPAGCAPGTETTVRDLFYNVPARKKFLKTDSTEEKHIIDIVSLISLAHPEVAFELTVDGRKILRTPANAAVQARIADIFGRDLAENMVPLSGESDNIRVTGFISRRGVTRPSRQEQRIFVNYRPVESLPVYRGIRDGCGPMLDKGRYHPACIFISMDPSLVDVNVHPAKREVRFRCEYELIQCVRDSVALALDAASGHETPVLDRSVRSFNPEEFLSRQAETGAALPPSCPPSVPETEPDAGTVREAVPLPPVSQPGQSAESVLASARVDYIPLSRSPSSPVPGRDLFRRREDEDEEEKPSAPPPKEAKEEQNPFSESENIRILGIIADTYIAAAVPDGLTLIDQHAAHERVMFERILHGVDGVLSQKLLIPITVEVSRSDALFIGRNTDLFSRIGFEAEPFGGNTVKLSAIPAAMDQNNAGGVFQDTLARIASEDNAGRNDTSMIARAACKAAVKAHDVLTPEECSALLKQLAKCELPYCCPHGRPTMIRISVRELERRFGRSR